jgi:hypothetical protein
MNEGICEVLDAVVRRPGHGAMGLGLLCWDEWRVVHERTRNWICFPRDPVAPKGNPDVVSHPSSDLGIVGGCLFNLDRVTGGGTGTVEPFCQIARCYNLPFVSIWLLLVLGGVACTIGDAFSVRYNDRSH